MNTITAKCPACGAMHTHFPETAEDSATCARCGAIYIPSECAVDADAISHEAAADSARYARQSEEHLRQIARDARLLANHLRYIYIIVVVLLLWDILGAVLGWLLRR